MPVTNIILFYATFIFIFLAGIAIYLFFFNKKTQSLRDKFFKQTNDFKPTVIKNIKLRYWTTRGTSTYTKTQISPNNKCDIYLFDNYLAIIRRQDFIFKAFFAPVIITSDAINLKSTFDYLEIHKPTLIHFSSIKKGEIEIKLPDPIYKTVRIDITLQGLTNEQTNQLEKIKHWADTYN